MGAGDRLDGAERHQPGTGFRGAGGGLAAGEERAEGRRGREDGGGEPRDRLTPGYRCRFTVTWG